ncbi:MAG TPA: S8 family serine peptidase, partial [Kofleriaceae bacterium]
CPRCNLLVVQADTSGSGLLSAQATAVELGADVISNSWGRAEEAGASLAAYEQSFDHPGVAIFAAAGDLGYDNGGTGPSYPATSAHVIAVGGTRLERSSDSRGYKESVWAKGGSGCSMSIAKPAYQADSPCAFRASADVAAVADPATGVAIYHSRGGGGWRMVGGTSAAAPLVAGIFAAAGHGHRTPASLAVHPASFHDVTAGKNGSCGTKLCEAGAGWDGPTGFGTVNGTVLASTVVPVEIPDDEPPVTTEEPETEPVAGCSAAGSSSSFVVALLIGLCVTRRRRVRA